MVTERWVLIQPSHRGGHISPPNMPWTNDSFHMHSMLLRAPCYHILDRNIPLDADVYLITNLGADLFARELEFINAVKSQGHGKVLIGFSQDFRFLSGTALLSEDGMLYTELCAAADAIISGVSKDLHTFGRYQDKAVPVGDFLQDYCWNAPLEQRDIDLLASGPGGEESLSFELEFLLMVKEKYPETRIVSCVQAHHVKLIQALRNRYPQITFSGDPHGALINLLKRARVYFNPELRPRPGRAIVEAYYCRVPFVAAKTTYFSCLCPDFSYQYVDFKELMERYEAIIHGDRDAILRDMEARAKEEMFEVVYQRIKTKLGI